jgi:hypothetical protein
MSTNDTRSIGQVLFEKLMPRRYEWRLLGDTDREKYERAAEVIFKRGHDARGKEERALTPKAKQYRDALVLMVAEAKHALDCVDEESKRDALAARIRLSEAVLK